MRENIGGDFVTVRFILGRSGKGKTQKMMDEIKQKLIEQPNGKPIIYLVPDQMTFQSEYDLVNTPNLGGMIRAQVYSLTRLAWKVLQETGGMSRYHISTVGLNMLIQKIIEDKKDELHIFTKASDKTGFIQHVERVLTEFKRYCIQPEDVLAQYQQMSEEGDSRALTDKLHDLHILFDDFEKGLFGKYVDSEDYFQLLAQSIGKSKYLQGAEIYIDGFHSFTPQEYLVIGELMKSASSVSVALTLDQPEIHHQADEIHLFRMTRETYATLFDLARQADRSVKNIVLEENSRFINQDLDHLEKYFESRPSHVKEDCSYISILQAANRRAEMEGVAREIRYLVREGNYRYKDIAVLVRNSHEYQKLIESIFYDYDIPFFIDQKRTMLNHPFIELIRSTLEIINSYWRYEPVFRAVKTDLLFPIDRNSQQLREQMDRLENYVLAYGIKGEQWIRKERWKYRRYRGLEMVNVPQTDEERTIENEMNELRLFITAPILRFARRLKKAKLGREFSEALYIYIEELDIPTKLERLSMEAEERGNLLASREHSQAWNAVMDLLDQFVEILGDEEVTLKKFTTILDAGFESMRFSVVPPAIDQVIVANLETSRLSNVGVAFVIGMNDGVLPAKLSEEGILADEDREILTGYGMVIAPSSKTRLLDEEFIAYKALTTPSKRLFVSYPIANEEGKALLPSPYLKRLKEMFPSLTETLLINEPSDLNEEGQFRYVCDPTSALSFLTTQLQLKKRDYPMYDFWFDVYNYFAQHPLRKNKAKRVLSSLFYQNKAKQLDEDVSRDLYGSDILASVSRMEQFHSCPFSHFARHGLKLKDREIFRLEAPDIGELFHGALKWISDEIIHRKLNWTDLTKKQCVQLAKEAVLHLAPKLQHQILLSSNRHFYIKQKLEQVIGRASYILSEHAKVSGFVPIGLELGFGPKAELPPFTFTLKNGTKMELMGRIDRVDKAEYHDEVYLRVIDYKSSKKDLDLTEMYFGLALQMITYLDIVLTHSPQFVGGKALPAGVLYFHVHNPMIDSKKILTSEQIEEELFKSFKMKGLVLGETDIVQLMDSTLDTGSSNIISAGLKKDGSITAKSKVATKDDFTFMRSHVRKMYEQSGNDIISGMVDISPYKYKKRTPCQFCSFKPVCQFDQSIEDNQYRLIVPADRAEIFEKLRKEESKHHGETPHS